MRFRNLRSTLRRLVLAGLPMVRLMNGCCPTDAGLYMEMSQQVTIDPRAEAFATAVDACRLSDQACVDLCRKILAEQGEMVAEDLIFLECRLFDVAEGESQVNMRYGYRNECVGGRRPAGLARGHAISARGAAGAWLAQTARLEAASVYAFGRLAAELRAAGAPRRLVSGALRSAGEEVRHAALLGGLARRYGARPVPADVRARRLRPLVEVAAENAAEGCVREGYGAAVATWQARAAADPAVRAAMSAIAVDETRHAALSFAIHDWAMPKLTPAERRRVATARRQAALDLVDAAGADDAGAGPMGRAARHALGLPDRAEARALARQWLAVSAA